ncbi:glucosaminidase domain-containing protein [Chitinophaga horti]|uniref:Glucosaminidase domain-containing protein n=1 Tax=Chitinophaga horti TaxID=2920382 RepID=A0ABY6IXZ8_9BACT|nr:glucosaminidase domain-containing protein [Chitinophaga horti]UYQ92253.1 glucosaminidase domain-containing protein [Chitinophaga horti]
MRLRKHIRRTLLIGGLCVCSMFAHAQTRTAKAYIKEYSPVAVSLMQETGIPASVMIGVAMLESGMGTSRNAKMLKNHFGIVGKNNLAKRGETYRSKYREYKSVDESYKHFARVIAKKKWFSQLKGTTDVAVWLKHMSHSGYSSAGDIWITRVSAMIKRYKLYELDGNLELAKE